MKKGTMMNNKRMTNEQINFNLSSLKQVSICIEQSYAGRLADESTIRDAQEIIIQLRTECNALTAKLRTATEAMHTASQKIQDGSAHQADGVLMETLAELEDE